MSKPKLFMLHFAGGSKYSYQFLIPHLQDFEVHLPELPGRGKRNTEKLLDEFPEALDDIYRQIDQYLEPERDIIYGHSLGAILGFRVIEKLEQENKKPKYLVVSGNPSPGVRKTEFLQRIHQLPEQEFVTTLKEMGGMPDGFFENKELFQYYEPIIRADMKLINSASESAPGTIDTPVLAVMGTRERNAYRIQEWSQYTRGLFDFKYLEGGHFFINDHPEAIASLLLKANRS